MASVKRRPGDYVLPLLALGMSFLGLVERAFGSDNIPALLVSLFGIVACVLFFVGHKWNIRLLYLWIVLQVPAIRRQEEIKIPNGKHHLNQSIFDAGQVITLDVGVSFHHLKGQLDVKVNLVPFGLLILYRLLLISSLTGRSVVIKRFSRDSKLGDVFPIEGKVLRSARLGKEKDWLLVELERALTYEGASFSHLLVRDKEGEIYKPGKVARVSYLVIVPEADMVGTGENRREFFRFAEWGMVAVKK